MSVPQNIVPPVLLVGDPPAKADHHRQRRLQYLTDAGMPCCSC